MMEHFGRHVKLDLANALPRYDQKGSVRFSSDSRLDSGSSMSSNTRIRFWLLTVIASRAGEQAKDEDIVQRMLHIQLAGVLAESQQAVYAQQEAAADTRFFVRIACVLKLLLC